MVSESLQKAMDNLEIIDIYQKGVACESHKDFDPKYFSQDYSTQFSHIVTKAEVVTIEAEIPLKMLRVFLALGVRLVASEDNSELVLTQVESEWIAEYKLLGEIPPDGIDEFSLKNVSYHVWPFWREYILNQAMRMRLPAIVLPTMQVAQNRI